MNKTLVLASSNPGKLREFNQLLGGLHIDVLPQSHFKVMDVEETGLSFVENALLKARHAAQHTNLPALADDSGLEVDALRGAPGIYSARYAGVAAGDAENLSKLLGELRDVAPGQRTARFQCVLVYLRHALDPTPLICQGTWEGSILTEPHGANGFGYDPIFYVPSHSCSAAQLAPQTKNSLSHRGQALRDLLVRLPRFI